MMELTEKHPPPRLVLDGDSDLLSRLLIELQHLLVRYPQAARALIGAFIAEGQQFARTPQGQARMKQLAGSQFVRRGRFIWDAYSLDALLESDPGRLPSAWLDVILAAVANPDLESILANLIVEEVEHGTFGASQPDRDV
jgi:hypothetical protein